VIIGHVSELGDRHPTFAVLANLGEVAVVTASPDGGALGSERRPSVDGEERPGAEVGPRTVAAGRGIVGSGHRTEKARVTSPGSSRPTDFGRRVPPLADPPRVCSRHFRVTTGYP
jgi:hypothetical protein